MMCRLKVNKIFICDYYFFVRCRRSPISHHHMVLVWSPIKRRKIPFWVCLFHTHTHVWGGVYIYVCARTHMHYSSPSVHHLDQVIEPMTKSTNQAIQPCARASVEVHARPHTRADRLRASRPSQSAPRDPTEPTRP
jgi:hypothetical protein